MGHLELRPGPRRVRHYLDGKHVRAGDLVEILLPNGTWVRGCLGHEYGGGNLTAKLHLNGGSGRGAWLWVRERDLLRWPDC